ncbi:MAG: acetate--CoA ligase family protein [Alphaproteobacteria bacterium]|nr:acetate--CoA ligase family protein [Alphaproteobacteria bacterium]
MVALAKALLAPDAVALIGASTDLDRPNGRPLRFLQKHGYRGRVYPVNPRADEIAGVRCYPDLQALPERPEHAFVLLAGDAAIDVIGQCGALGIPCATVFSGGFAEAGAAGAARQDSLRSAARRAGVRILGPNSIGLINVVTGLALSANAMLELPELPRGRAAVVSQSGSMLGAILSHGEARRQGFSKLVSVGNESDLSVGEITGMLVDDPETEAVMLFLETIRDREQLAVAAQRAHALGKPLIAYRLGRSAIGQALAQSHTGALASSDKAFAAYLAHHGIAEVAMFEAFIEAPRVFRGRRPTTSTAPRVAIVTTTGGGGAMVADNLGIRGATIAETPSTVANRLAAAGVHQDVGRLVDLTMAGARPEVVSGVITDLMSNDAVDAVVMVVGSSARFHPELAVTPLLPWATAAKPFMVYLAPEAEDSLRRLAGAGVPVFRSPEACADALASLLGWRSPATRPTAKPLAPPTSARKLLTEVDALAYFGGLGIRAVSGEVASDPDHARRIADRLGYPVVLKVASPDIAHKSNVGGVILGLEGGPAVVAAYQKIRRAVSQKRPDAAVTGVLVQTMRRGLAEVILGFKQDPVVGPLVMLGAGGVLAEIYADTSVRLAPLDAMEARRMIEEVAGLAPIRGYRDAPRGDLAALTEAVVAMSWLADVPTIIEAEINPLLVLPEGSGIVAADGLVVLGNGPAK